MAQLRIEADNVTSRPERARLILRSGSPRYFSNLMRGNGYLEWISATIAHELGHGPGRQAGFTDHQENGIMVSGGVLSIKDQVNNKFDQSFGRYWRAPFIGCAFGFIAGAAFSISIMSLRRISLLHASKLVYERLKAIEDKISIPGDIIMRLVKYDPPYPDGSNSMAEHRFRYFF